MPDSDFFYLPVTPKVDPCTRRHRKKKCRVNNDKTQRQFITKTCVYNFDPLKPHFYIDIVKLGFTVGIFLISAQNIDYGYSLEPPCRGGSNEYPQCMFCNRNMTVFIYFFFFFFFFFLWGGGGGGVKYSIYLDSRVFVMYNHRRMNEDELPQRHKAISLLKFFVHTSMFYMWCLICHYLFLISPSVGSWGKLCLATVAFGGYLHIIFGRSVATTIKWAGLKLVLVARNLALIG